MHGAANAGVPPPINSAASEDEANSRRSRAWPGKPPALMPGTPYAPCPTEITQSKCKIVRVLICPRCAQAHVGPSCAKARAALSGRLNFFLPNS